MNEDNFHKHLPRELQDIAAALAEHRDVADGHLLERVLRRVKSSQRPARLTFASAKMRLASVAALICCFAVTMTGAQAAVLAALGGGKTKASPLSLVSSVAATSTNTNNSAADDTYEKPGCGNEQNDGISGGSGAHGGQPPKAEERGQCPHDPGEDGDVGDPDPDPEP